MPAQARIKGIKQSPRKVAVVAALVRGRRVDDAITILEHTPRRSALAVRKAIESARANADYNHGYKPASLRIVEISVTPGPRLKRIRPAWRGTANPYQKKTSHLLVIVDGEKRQSKSSTKPENDKVKKSAHKIARTKKKES
jgi:large subunit ribosomal protein L22